MTIQSVIQILKHPSVEKAAEYPESDAKKLRRACYSDSLMPKLVGSSKNLKHRDLPMTLSSYLLIMAGS